MNEQSICTDYLEIIAGTSNFTSKNYVEAVKNTDPNKPRGMGYIKNFMQSIESTASKSKEARIDNSKGNIQSFEGHDKIQSALSILKEHLSTNPITTNLSAIYDALIKYRAQYINGYDKHIRLIILEYESAVYLLVTGLTFTLVNCITINEANGSIIKKNAGHTNGLISKLIKDLSAELNKKEHLNYLNGLLTGKEHKQVKESVIMEGVVAETLELIDSIMTNVGKIGKFAISSFDMLKRTLFGILPLIRGIIYLRYKKKGDTILALEQQIAAIQMNIEYLKNHSKGMTDEQKKTIIKKQQAIINAYNKKAEKLRAELIETETETSDAIKNDKDVTKDSSDDFIIEDGLINRLKQLGGEEDE